MSEDLAGQSILVTGGSLGIGKAVSEELARRGAHVTVVARGEAALNATVRNLPGTGHAAVILDVSDAQAWSAAAAEIDAQGPLRGVVCCAGILGPVGRFDEIDPRAFMDTLSVNLLGTLLALRFAVPRLEQTGGRAVALSGGGATGPMPRYDGYASSKAAVVRLVENVAQTTSVEINCLAPGFVATRMHDVTLAAGPDKAGTDYFSKTQRQLDEGGFPATEAAELAALLLGDEASGITGRLISAQWDPWREREFRSRLRDDNDLGRVRRIDGQQFRAF
jgi:NAD(P)-dependent dehydrogenase (short-subunit alcohol dehydrogenase family)